MKRWVGIENYFEIFRYYISDYFDMWFFLFNDKIYLIF